MTDQVTYRCNQHADRFDCADNVVYFSRKLQEYGLIIHDGGSSYLTISFCPWCGAKLPEPSEQEELPTFSVAPDAPIIPGDRASEFLDGGG